MRALMHKRCCFRFPSLLTNAFKISRQKKRQCFFFFRVTRDRVTANLMASRLVASHVANFTSASWHAPTRVGVTGCGVESNKHTKQQNRELRLVSLSKSLQRLHPYVAVLHSGQWRRSYMNHEHSSTMCGQVYAEIRSSSLETAGWGQSRPNSPNVETIRNACLVS